MARVGAGRGVGGNGSVHGIDEPRVSDQDDETKHSEKDHVECLMGGREGGVNVCVNS